MRRFGQTKSGLVEDAIVFAGGMAIANPKLMGVKSLEHHDSNSRRNA